MTENILRASKHRVVNLNFFQALKWERSQNYYSPGSQKTMRRKYSDKYYKELPDFVNDLLNHEQYRVKVPEVRENKFVFYNIPPHARLTEEAKRRRAAKEPHKPHP